MYERSAIVLERYFENLLEYRREGNLRDNFYFYCELVEKLEKYQVNYQKEFIAIQDYNETLKKIKQIQLTQEKLYKRSAKLEYNRNLLFNNLDGKVEDIEKCIVECVADLENVILIRGFDLVPKDSGYFADLRLHPNDKGFDYYYKNLLAEIKKHL